MKLTFETTVRELKCTLSMRRYSNDLEMENGGTEVYEKGLHDEGTGTVREDKELIRNARKDRGVDTRIHSDHVVVVRGWVLDTYLHDERTGRYGK